jgi:signal transduction histidine kinase/CheY-like chemotaxis protein
MYKINSFLSSAIFKKYCILVFLMFFGISAFSQKSKNAEREVKKLISETGKYLNSAQNDKSLTTAKKALNLALENNLDSYSARIYNLIGLNFSNSKDYKNADLYYKKGLDYALKIKNDTILSWVYNNLGNLYSYSKKDARKGIEYYLKAVDYSKKVDEIEYMYNALNLANTYIELNELKKARYFLTEVEPILVKFNKEYEASYFYNSLSGGYYDAIKNNKLAEKYYLNAEKVCLGNHPNFLKTNEVEIYKTLSDFYKKNNSYKKAYSYIMKSDSLKQKLFDAERNDNIKILSQEIEKEEVKRELVKVEAEKKIQEQKLANNKVFIILICIIFFACLMFLYNQLKLNRFKTKTNKLLLQSNEELKIANIKSEEASLLKSQFLSNVSHELRTPLYGVIGMADIIESEHVELKKDKYFKALKFSSNYLLSLINDVLNVYKIEDTKFELIYDNIEIRKEIQVIIESLSVIAKSNKNTLNVEISEALPQFIKTDLTRFSQIVINLISNSLKFTKNGNVLIKLELITINKEPKIQIKVEDNGIGIPEEYVDKIFEKFVQVDVNLNEQYKGTGLGLSIVKSLVNLFHGEIFLKSEINKGTVFTVQLPYIKANLEVYNQNVNSHIGSNKVNLKILIVEDNKINQMVTKKLLDKSNHSCKIVENGYEAIKIVEKTAFDLILMDIHMPVLNGFEASKKIRELGILTPIIALTASDKNEIINEMAICGINDVLVKPFEIRDLQIIIEKHV